MIIWAVPLLIGAGIVTYMMSGSSTKAKFAMDPMILATEVKACEVSSQGINDLDGDNLDNNCDPCIDEPDGGEHDKNGNHMSDYCENSDSSDR